MRCVNAIKVNVVIRLQVKDKIMQKLLANTIQISKISHLSKALA